MKTWRKGGPTIGRLNIDYADSGHCILSGFCRKYWNISWIAFSCGRALCGIVNIMTSGKGIGYA